MDLDIDLLCIKCGPFCVRYRRYLWSTGRISRYNHKHKARKMEHPHLTPEIGRIALAPLLTLRLGSPHPALPALTFNRNN